MVLFVVTFFFPLRKGVCRIFLLSLIALHVSLSLLLEDHAMLIKSFMVQEKGRILPKANKHYTVFCCLVLI